MSDAETPLRDLDLPPDDLALESVRRFIRDLGTVRYQEAWAHEDPYLRVVRAGDYMRQFVLGALMSQAIEDVPDGHALVDPYGWATETSGMALLERSVGALSAAASRYNVRQHPLGLANRLALELHTWLETPREERA